MSRLSLILGLLLSIVGKAQTSSVKLFADVPVQFGIGYEGQLSNRFSITFSGGMLVEPNSMLLLGALESFGSEKSIIDIVTTSFEKGIVGQVGLNYNFGKNYIGTFVQVIDLLEADTRTEFVETYFETSINDYPLKQGATPTNETHLELKSMLYQAGLLYGRRFTLPSKHIEFNIEIGVSANAWSHSKLTSEFRDIHSLSQELDDVLLNTYREYAFIPSLKFALVYRLKATPF